MSLLDALQSPQGLLGLSVLANANRPAQGLLQGIAANQQMQQQGLQQQLAQAQILKAQQEQKDRESFKKVLPPEFAGVTSSDQLNALVNARELLQGTPGGFQGTSVKAQAMNIYARTQQKLDRGQPLTAEESYDRLLAKRELEQPKVVGTPETGFQLFHPQPLSQLFNQGAEPSQAGGVPAAGGGAPAAGAASPRGGGGGNNFRVPINDLTNLRDSQGNPAPFGTTYEDILDPNSQYKAMTQTDVTKMLESKSALGLLDELRNLSGVGTDNSVFSEWDNAFERIGAAASNAKDYVGGTDDRSRALRIYRDQRQGVLSMFVRALGEKGTLATKDISRIDAALPKVWPLPDDPKDAKSKFDSLERMFKTIGRMMDEGTYDPENGLPDNWEASSGAPEGVPAEEWEVMTPEEKALWQN